MKKLLVFLFMYSRIGSVNAQFNNEWIDHSKTYFKFKVANKGIHRIPFSALQAAGLASVPLEQFQLFRNGKEVPLYTSKSSGLPAASDFIEFFGKPNDGTPDAAFYKKAGWRINSTISLLTDTATYFLTIEPKGRVERMVASPNELDQQSRVPEPYFMYTFKKAFKDKINLGDALVSNGLYIHSSAYEPGEGWTSRDIYPGSPLNESFALYPASINAMASVSIAFSGNTMNTRNVEILLNNNSIFDSSITGFSIHHKRVYFPLHYLGRSNIENITIRNRSNNSSDRIVVGEMEITYPRLFNFDGASVFEFSLPAKQTNYYLEIAQFNGGSSPPVLLDLTHKQRFEGVISNGLVKFVLKPSVYKRELVLVSTSSPISISNLEPRNFTDYTRREAQGDYLIISHKNLTNGLLGDPVEKYRVYRSSTAGGNYDAKLFDVSELIDQFGFGIRWNPLGIKNFIEFARTRFAVKPRYIFLIGRGLLYNDARANERFPITYQMQLLPTYGSPGSDHLLVSSGYDVNIDIPVGRLAAISAEEVEIYLQKVKQHESGRAFDPPTISDRAWRKNMVHAVGGKDPYLQSILSRYMQGYAAIARDTLLGAHVHTFSKAEQAQADLLTSNQLVRLFNKGIAMITYFGHSATDILEFNIDDPGSYDNAGKYPFFLVNGCYAGNVFIYDTTRLSGIGLTLSEKYMFSKERGSIGFLAHSNIGVVNYLNVFTEGFYTSLSKDQYGKPFGDILRSSLSKFSNAFVELDHLGRTHKEQMVLHADPALCSFGYALPDYVIEDPLVKIAPNMLSVANKDFKLRVQYANIGKAIHDSISVLIQRKLPNGMVVDLFNMKRKAALDLDSFTLTVPINPLTDIGVNQILIAVDATQAISEHSELNNSIVKEFAILEQAVRPVYPLSYAFYNKPIDRFYASMANPLTPSRWYAFDLDTTAQFNSPVKVSTLAQGQGGMVVFAPAGITWKDSTVYYWRTAPAGERDPTWSVSSFIYNTQLPNGFGMAHFDQHKHNTFHNMHLDDDRRYYFNVMIKKLTVKNGLYPHYVNNKLLVTLDETVVVNYGCRYSALQVIVLDGKTLKPWENKAQLNGMGLYGSWLPCNHNARAFEFPYADPVYRKNAVAFLESLPDGVVICISNFGRLENTSFIADWIKDTLELGKDRSLYHSLKRLGFTVIDSFTRNLPFLFVARKRGEVLKQLVGSTAWDYIEESLSLAAFSTSGSVASPWLGPAESWSKMLWKGKLIDPITDRAELKLFGRDKMGVEYLLFSTTNQDTTLESVDADVYPFLRMEMHTRSALHAIPIQLEQWMLAGKFPAEGGVVSVSGLTPVDTVEAGKDHPIQIVFKNISSTAFDSLLVKCTTTNSANVTTHFPLKKIKPLNAGDTSAVTFFIDTRNLMQDQLVHVFVNPSGIQPEQYLFNNNVFGSFYVKSDLSKPVLDITFDGVRILNQDIVAAKPHILIKLTDDSKYMLLDDTSLLIVRVRYPNNEVRQFRFDNDTIRFIPALFSNGMNANTATIEFTPFFKEDGLYELIVAGKDRSGNRTGFMEDKVLFNVMNKPMISELLNYPNPFTSSTAFVFTLTGPKVPDHLRIQIMTITGKIVREITKEELGPIRIGRNITEYKWDGTDQFGQKLANGVYLYRVITQMHGRSLDKLDTKAEINTVDQKYFNKGYGKMYLMR